MDVDVHAQQRVAAGERAFKTAAYAAESVVRNHTSHPHLEEQGMKPTTAHGDEFDAMRLAEAKLKENA